AVGDGEVFVGEPDNRTRAGHVYVYRKVGGAWTRQESLTAPQSAPGDGFGAALAWQGNRMLVSQPGDDAAGTIHVFEKRGTSWAHAGTFSAGAAGDAFGESGALNGDVALVGAPGDADGAGAVYVFRRGAAGAWAQEAKLTVPDSATQAGFGRAVAFVDQLALVGAPNAEENTGRLYVFVRDANGWRSAVNITPNGLGPNARFASALAVDGTRLLAGVPGFGAQPPQPGRGGRGGGRGGRGGRGGAAGAVGAVFAFEFDTQAGTIQTVGRYLPF